MKIKTQVTMKKHILNWYNKATGIELVQGLEWYNDANEYAMYLADKYNVKDLFKVSQVIALLSRQVDWETNKVNAEKMIKCWRNRGAFMSVKIFATDVQKANCIDCLNGEYSIPVTALKTRSFAVNIYNPSISDCITIDRHATKVALNDLKAGGVSLTRKNYFEISKAYKAVSLKLGIKASQLQAITWITYKKEVNR
jgi:hypothetical protein